MDKKEIFVFFLLLCSLRGFTQALRQNSPRTGNPIIPGYFADPTIKKWGDTYYIYATTDGNGFGLGPSQVWKSKDFVNWYMEPMNWPNTPIYWAPDVNKASDGKYYMYYSQPCELYGAFSASPTGPWTPLLPGTEAVIPNYFVPNVITLDGQTFRDDDGKMYMFWGTWGIYPNSGCGMGLLNADMKSFAKTGIIPNTIAKDFFEAPFMFKRNGIYYLMYSAEHCEDASYKVHYVTSKEGPMGPFVYGKNSPVLVTNEDGTVHGPGHNSVLQEGDNFYIVYHRHNNPHSGGGFHRQIAVDKLEFDEEGSIKKVVPTHQGIGALAKNTIQAINLAFGKQISASSVYSDDFRADYAADDNNGTLWKAADNMHEAWWQVDLGKEECIRSVLTQFEYATWYYQYLMEYSNDGQRWKVFADRTQNTQWGSPMKDYGDVKARYFRITIKNTQLSGLNRAIWNVKIFSEPRIGYEEGKLSTPQAPVGKQESLGLLVDLEAEKYALHTADKKVANKGVLGGLFRVKNGSYTIDLVQGRKAFVFDGQSYWQSEMALPPTIGGNSSFTISAWINNPNIAKEEPIIQWASGGRDLTHASLGYGSDPAVGGVVHGGWANLAFKDIPSPNKWHHVVLVFDGTEERLYVNGKLENRGNRMLFLERSADILIGTDRRLQHFFSGAIASLKMYDYALTTQEIEKLRISAKKSAYVGSFESKDLVFGKVKTWINKGYGKSGIELQNQDAELLAYKGQMAVYIKNGRDALLPYLKSTLDSLAYYSLVLVYADGKRKTKDTWALTALVKQRDGLYCYYSDKWEKRNELNAELMKMIPSKGIYLKSLHLLNEAKDESELKLWADSVLNLKPDKPINPTYTIDPKWVSEELAFMEVDTSLANRGYQFSFQNINNDSTSSIWQSATHYLAQDLTANRSPGFRYFVKDGIGNVWTSKEKVLQERMESGFHDTLTNINLQIDFPAQHIWDGMEGASADSAVLSVEGGAITLASAKSAWDGSEKKGPFLYKKEAGNFLIQLKVSDVSGLKQRKPLGANEVGLMVRPIDEGRREQLLQNGIMLGWGIGNMVTDLDRGRRQQHNNTGFDFYSYLQIQREGAFIFIRGSKDGKRWIEFPGSPYFKPNWMGKDLQVGPYQASYGEKKGYGVFSEIRLYEFP
uniref:Glycoside hydrolase family 43 n=1 Tax=Sphingobacterium sp. (strain 21) TaxID=743722 RepID=F4CCP2_SPHS2